MVFRCTITADRYVKRLMMNTSSKCHVPLLSNSSNVYVVFSVKGTFLGVFCVAVFTLWHQDVLLVVWSSRERIRSEVNYTARDELNSGRLYLEYIHIII